MKKIYPVLAAAIFAGSITTAAFAGNYEEGTPGTSSQHQGSHADSTAHSKMHKNFQGEHTMRGTVSKIDHQEGTISVKTSEETLDLHYPPAAIKDLKEGDEVAVHLGITKQNKTAATSMENQ